MSLHLLKLTAGAHHPFNSFGQGHNTPHSLPQPSLSHSTSLVCPHRALTALLLHHSALSGTHPLLGSHSAIIPLIFEHDASISIFTAIFTTATVTHFVTGYPFTQGSVSFATDLFNYG